GLVEIEPGMRVLQGRDAQASPDQAGNDLGEEGGFSGAAPARETDDTHAPVIAPCPEASQRPQLRPAEPPRRAKRCLRPFGPAAMTLQQYLAFAVIAGMMILFVWGRLRYDVVALLTLLVAIAVGIVPHDKAFSGFSDDIVVIVASALVVSGAVARSGM